MNSNFDFFLKTDLHQFSGKWVVIVNNKVVESGEDIKKMLEEVNKKYHKAKPLVAKIPKEEYYII
jgi:orotate phosphoribosyltransferase-like protein